MITTSLSPRTDTFLEAVFPILGIAFVLVVFFLLYLAFARAPSLEINGAGGDPTVAAGGAVFLRVASAGTIHVKERVVDLSGVKAALSEMRFELPRSTVVVLAEPGAPSAVVFRVADQCRLAGAGTIRLEMAKESR